MSRLSSEYLLQTHVNRGGFPKIPRRDPEGAGGAVASVVTGIGQNVGPPAVSTGTWTMTPDGQVQKVRLNDQSPPQAARQGTQDSQPVNHSELPPAKRLDGEVVILGDIPFSEGMHYEIWTGQWRKGPREVGGERVEKVGLSLTTPTLLT